MENFILTISFLFLGMGLRRLPHFPLENGAGSGQEVAVQQRTITSRRPGGR